MAEEASRGIAGSGRRAEDLWAKGANGVQLARITCNGEGTRKSRKVQTLPQLYSTTHLRQSAHSALSPGPPEQRRPLSSRTLAVPRSCFLRHKRKISSQGFVYVEVVRLEAYQCCRSGMQKIEEAGRETLRKCWSVGRKKASGAKAPNLCQS